MAHDDADGVQVAGVVGNRAERMPQDVESMDGQTGILLRLVEI